MTTITQLSPELSVAGQIAPEDVSAIRDGGFRSIIGNRPDGEETGQPEWDAVAAAAQEAGLATRFIPVGADYPIEDQRHAFAQALDELPGPILAYCRTGNRCGQIYAASQNLRGGS